jgi:glycosyltransferase involved in cell wall biosynthesis
MADLDVGLRVLFVIDGLGTGGAERSLSELLPFLRDAGIRATVVTFYERRGVDDAVRSQGFDVRRVGASRLPGRVIDVRRMIKSEGIDVVHTTLHRATLVGRLAAAGTGVPVLTSLVNTPYDHSRRDRTAVARWRLSIAHAADRVTARRTSHFHAISDAVAQDARAGLGIRAPDITVIPRGRSSARLGEPDQSRRRTVRDALGLAPDQPVLLAVGRQEEQKGHRYLVEAMDHVLASVPDAVLLLAGREGHATPQIQAALRRISAPESVRVLDHRDDVGDLLAATDVFVFPSLWEGLGGALIEAMAMALPVVASDLAVFREFVEDGPEGNGVLVPPQDPAALARAIVELLHDPDRRAAMGRRSREIFEARFTLEAIAPRMIQLFREVART